MSNAPTTVVSLPLRRRNTTVKKPTNLNLTTETVNAAAQVADQRYHTSLSEMTDRLLAKEISLKRGLLGRRERK